MDTWSTVLVIKRNPTPGSPAYEELQRKRAAKESGISATDALGAIENQGSSSPDTTKPTQRVQPSRSNKKKKK